MEFEILILASNQPEWVHIKGIELVFILRRAHSRKLSLRDSAIAFAR